MNRKFVHTVLLLLASLCLLSGCSARKAYLARHCYEEGRAAAKEHKWTEALAKYDQAISLKPDYAAAYRKAQASHPNPEMQQRLQARLSELGAK